MAPVRRRCHSTAKSRSRYQIRLWIIALLAIATQYSCSQPTELQILRIGLSAEPRTLNIWLSGDRNTSNVLSQIYQPLYIREPDKLAFVPWLAAELPIYDARQMTYTVKLRSVSWSDGRPLTSADVAFTARLVQEFKIPRYSSKWRLIKSIETPDAKTIVFHLKKPFATFLGGSMMVPIVPAHQWAPIAAIARKAGVALNGIIPSAIREEHQRRIEADGVDLLLAEMPSDLRANRPFVRDLRWLRDTSECDTILFRNRGLESIDSMSPGRSERNGAMPASCTVWRLSSTGSLSRRARGAGSIAVIRVPSPPSAIALARKRVEWPDPTSTIRPGSRIRTSP